MVTRLQSFQKLQSLTQPRTNKGNSGESSSASFLSSFQRAQQSASNSRQPGDQISSIRPGQVVQSPFNPLGLPVSNTLAPTAAEVQANPEKWRGTSFDPARGIRPAIWQMRELEGWVPPGATSW